jgi:regulator of replication initiation timing
MSDHEQSITTIHSQEYKHLTEMVLKLKRSIEVLKQDNKSLMNDNTRLRKEVDTWMRKSHENLRLSFKGNNE